MSDHPRIVALRDCQRQLDADGCEVGVSRQALDETLASYEELLAALKGLLAFAEDAETKALVGDEGCLWPVEAARAAIARATGEA